MHSIRIAATFTARLGPALSLSSPLSFGALHRSLLGRAATPTSKQMASYSSPPTYKPSTYAAAQNPDVYAEDYDWVINKLRARGFKTLQDRRAEAE